MDVKPTSRGSDQPARRDHEALNPVDPLESQDGAKRALAFLQRFSSTRANAVRTLPTSIGNFEASLLALLDAAVPGFSDWCVIELVDDHDELRQFAMRHNVGGEIHADNPHANCCETGLLARVPELPQVATRVLASGKFETWPSPDAAERPWCLVMALEVNGRTFGTVTFVNSDARAGYSPADVTAAREVGWSTGALIERALLDRDAREAVRQTQRIASQLHQLIASSITVAGLRSEQDILKNLANSTRNVFDADTALISLDTGSVSPLRAVARKARGPARLSLKDDPEAVDLPIAKAGSTTPWRESGWLIAPLLERRDRARGLVAIQRRSGAEFGAEDTEVLALIAQMASTALGAVELSRTIQNSEERLRILVETAPIGIVEVDAEDRVRWWNRAAGQIFSWPVFADTPNNDPGFPLAAMTGLDVLWAQVRSGTSARGREFAGVEVNDRRKDLTISAVLLPSALGESENILTLIDDVTDHRQLKEEVRHAHGMETRGQVASSVAHDFNNLLTLISGYAEMLSQDLDAQDRSIQMVKDIQTTASRASMLTGQLLTIGRTKTSEPVVLNPAALIRSNAEVLERILGVEVTLICQFDAESINVRVDVDQFEQMILNLALNARDSMPTGGQLSICVDSVSLNANQAGQLNATDGDYVLIDVTDTGSGMDEETLRHCFEPLFTTKGPFKGTGLGLPAARRLVEDSGGVIRCTSALGRGTTFEIFLPAVNEQVIGQAASGGVDRPRGSATVLVAEDDEAIRHLMIQALKRNGYSVLEADSGRQALELAQGFDGTIDLLLSDVVLPYITGDKLAASVQAMYPMIRVMLVSGSADSTILDGLIPGSSTFLAKPFKPSELIDHIHGLLARGHS